MLSITGHVNSCGEQYATQQPEFVSLDHIRAEKFLYITKQAVLKKRFHLCCAKFSRNLEVNYSVSDVALHMNPYCFLCPAKKRYPYTPFLETFAVK